jgi:hypothetical protein
MKDKAKNSSRKETVIAISEIVKAVPVYQDVVQPSAKEIGKSLATITKTINIALGPIKLLVWGYDQIEEYLTKKIAEKLKETPEENIITPPTYIAGPAIEALRFAGYNEDLRELYANLLATSMDKNTADKAHPGYVDIIKNISPDEARLLKVFTKEDNLPLINISLKNDPERGRSLAIANYTLLNDYLNLNNSLLITIYITNLCRLGILEIPYGIYLAEVERYEKIENSEVVTYAKEKAKEKAMKIDIERRVLRLTTYGEDFIKCVVKE